MHRKFTRTAFAVAAIALAAVAAVAAPMSAEAQSRLNFEGSSRYRSGPAGSALLIDFLMAGQVSGTPTGTVLAIETIAGDFDPEIAVGTPGSIRDLQFDGGNVIGQPIPDFLSIGGYTFSLGGVEAGGNFGPITLIAVTPTNTLLAYSVFGTVTGPDIMTARNYQGIFTAQFAGRSIEQVQNAIQSRNGTMPVSFSAEFIVADAQVVPEPSTYILLATGLGALGVVGLRRRNATQV